MSFETKNIFTNINFNILTIMCSTIGNTWFLQIMCIYYTSQKFVLFKSSYDSVECLLFLRVQYTVLHSKFLKVTHSINLTCTNLVIWIATKDFWGLSNSMPWIVIIALITVLIFCLWLKRYYKRNIKDQWNINENK